MRLIPRRLRITIIAALAGWPAALAFAQAPDRRGEAVSDRPSYRGESANAPIPPAMHIRNEGGSDGAGLCVISSVTINGHYQGVPGLDAGKGSLLWRTAKARPGGYSPDKLASLVDEVMPDERYASYVGTNPAILDRLSGEGYPVGATMSTGALYGYRPIHHMISLAHYRTGGYACVVDNNDPGKYHWMPADEFARRWIDGGVGWAWIWTRKSAAGPALAALLLLTAAAVVLIGSRPTRPAEGVNP